MTAARYDVPAGATMAGAPIPAGPQTARQIVDAINAGSPTCSASVTQRGEVRVVPLSRGPAVTMRNCEICRQRFVVGGERRLTCSAKCRSDLAARRASAPPVVPECRSQTTPNRAREALTATRAAVAQLLFEGRRARLTNNGESA